MIVLAIMNSFFIPLELNFDFKKEIFERRLFIMFDYLIDLLFALDIIITFFSSYRNLKGQEIFNQWKIAKNYVFSLVFYADLISVLGSNFFTSLVPQMKTLSYAKLIRIRRLGRYIRSLKLPVMQKEMFNLLKLLLYLTLSLHISACLWFSLTSIDDHEREEEEKAKDFVKSLFGEINDHDHDEEREDHWIPPYDFINYKDVKIYTGVYSQFRLYTIYFYHAVLFLNLNELAPVNKLELMFAICILLGASLVYMQLFGDIILIMGQYNRQSNMYQTKLDKALEVMDYIEMDYWDQIEIKDFYKKTSLSKDKQEDFDSFMDQIAPSYKVKIQVCIFTQKLLKNKVIAKCATKSDIKVKKENLSVFQNLVKSFVSFT